MNDKVILGKSGVTSAGWHRIEGFLRCPKYFQYKEIRGIHKPQTATPEAFAVGILHHAMRAHWFALKFPPKPQKHQLPDKIVAARDRAMKESDLPISTDARNRATELFSLYMDHWLLLPRPTPIVAEYLVGPVPLWEEDRGHKELYRTARLDDVSHYPEAGGKLCIGEAKTTSGSIGDVVTQYQLHGQTLLQYLLWKMSKNGEEKHGPVQGIMLDISVKPYERKRAAFERVFVPISEWSAQWYAKSMRGYLKAASMVNWDTDVPRNVQGCTYFAGRMRVACEFRPLCMHGKSGSSHFVLGEKGTSLLDHEPEPGREVMPWT